MSATCHYIHDFFFKEKKFYKNFDETEIPLNGIYILYEKGEQSHGMDRIVRVGTHTGTNNLYKRLKEHLFTPNKDRSIFRKHVGRAILSGRKDDFADQWDICLTSKIARKQYASQICPHTLARIEQEVTAYMKENFYFSVWQVENKIHRLDLEKKLLSTIHQCEECHPSPNWLGRRHPDVRINKGCLWNIVNVNGPALSLAEAQSFFKNGKHKNGQNNN